VDGTNTFIYHEQDPEIKQVDCEISGSHGGEYEDDSLLGYYTV
jgi:hypothetical protein